MPTQVVPVFAAHFRQKKAKRAGNSSQSILIHNLDSCINCFIVLIQPLKITFWQVTICQNVICRLCQSLPDTLRSAAIQLALSKSFHFVVGQGDKYSRRIAHSAEHLALASVTTLPPNFSFRASIEA